MTGWIRTKAICLVAGWLSLHATTVRAQVAADEGDPVRVIVSPGAFLAGGTEMDSGIGAVAHIAVERGRHRVLFRSVAIADVTGFPDGSGEGDLSEVGLLYGKRGGGPGPGWSVSAGVAAVHFQRCPDDGADPGLDPGCTTVGIPVVAEIGVGAKVVGLGLQLFGNLNAHAPFAGLGLSLPLGWMP